MNKYVHYRISTGGPGNALTCVSFGPWVERVGEGGERRGRNGGRGDVGRGERRWGADSISEILQFYYHIPSVGTNPTYTVYCLHDIISAMMKWASNAAIYG